MKKIQKTKTGVLKTAATKTTSTKTTSTKKTLSVKERVLRVILRGRGESLGQACKAAGLTPTTYYYYVKTASFGNPKRGRTPKFSLSAQDVKKFTVILKKHGKIENELKKLETKIASN